MNIVFPRLLTAALTAILAPAVMAGTLTDFEAFLARVNTLKAGFHQELFDEKGRSIESSTGEFFLSRPDRFRWNYLEPYHQEIVADGSRVWMFDSELEQVTVKSVGDALGSTPARLLSSRAPIEEDFETRELGPQDGLQWVELKPRNSESTFTALRIGLAGDSLRQMELRDNFGQNTRLDFSDVEENPDLPDDLFNFTPPPGVDVIREQD